MPMEHKSNYHRALRIATVVCAAVLLFESGLVRATTRTLAYQTNMFLATSLVARENADALSSTVALAHSVYATPEQTLNKTLYLISGVTFIFLTLMVLNYAVGFVSSRQPAVVKNKRRPIKESGGGK